MDVVFALDSSGSIERENFARALQFVGAVIQSLTIRSDQSPDGLQVAFVTFADSVDIRFLLNTYTDKELMLAAINAAYTHGRTDIDLVLRYSLPHDAILDTDKAMCSRLRSYYLSHCYSTAWDR